MFFVRGLDEANQLEIAGEFFSAVIPGRLKRDEMRVNHHRALDYCLSMIFSENRFTLFRIML
jgi:hypothetical protein